MRLPQEERLVALLLAKAADAGIVDLSQGELALHLGTSRDVVSRLLRNLANQDLIESGLRRIALRDVARLKTGSLRRQARRYESVGLKT